MALTAVISMAFCRSKQHATLLWPTKICVPAVPYERADTGANGVRGLSARFQLPILSWTCIQHTVSHTICTSICPEDPGHLLAGQNHTGLLHTWLFSSHHAPLLNRDGEDSMGPAGACVHVGGSGGSLQGSSLQKLCHLCMAGHRDFCHACQDYAALPHSCGISKPEAKPYMTSMLVS